MFVVPIADHPYYLWQALVQAVELKKLGIPATYLGYTQGTAPSPRLRAMMDAGLADWHVWQDWRTEKVYNAAMKPWLVGRWLAAHPEQSSRPFTILDPDAIPTRRHVAEVTATSWAGTDTDMYTGPAYLRSKAGVWESLCALVGVNPAKADRPGVGAQLTVVGQPGEFWETVATKSVDAHALLTQSGTDVQAWCAEMYVTALEAARRDIAMTADPEMSMVWANGPASGWSIHGFFHCAGVVAENGRDFCKITYQEAPWGKRIKVHPSSASARYVELIRQAERLHPELTLA